MKKIVGVLFAFLLFFGSNQISAEVGLGFPNIVPMSRTPVEGHSVLYSQSVDETLDWKLKLIENAQYSIEMSTGYASGTSFDRLLTLLEAKMGDTPELKVHLLITDVPTMSSRQKEWIKRIATTYPDRFFYRIDGFIPGVTDKKFYTFENHMKFMIVDESYFLLGGSNLLDSDVNVTKEGLIGGILPKAYADSDIVGRGPEATTLRKDFFQIYSIYEKGISLNDVKNEYRDENNRYFTISRDNRAFVEDFEYSPKLINDAAIIARVSGPRYKYESIGKAINSRIKKATQSIDMGQLYFFPYEALYDSIVAASDRGVSISLITNGLGSNAPGSTVMYAHGSRVNYFPVMVGEEFSVWDGIAASKAKVKNPNIYEYNVKDVLYHNKVTVIDDLITFVGSYNYGVKSQVADFEVSLEVHSPGFAGQVKNKLIEDRKQSKKITRTEAIDYYYNPLYKMADYTESIIFDGRVG
jgi:phosphatidylserine/phosphatidylglycerophosphate/cardiolipin synthase-like enzyme